MNIQFIKNNQRILNSFLIFINKLLILINTKDRYQALLNYTSTAIYYSDDNLDHKKLDDKNDWAKKLSNISS